MNLLPAAGVALLVTLSVNIWQFRQNGALKTELGTVRAQLTAAVAANESQSRAISELELAVDEWKRACSLTDEIRAEAAQASAFRARIESLSAELARAKANASTDCTRLLETDFGNACPTVLDLLRERAAGH